ncbi:MAG TPA: sterol desaturase family protein [Stellaceae bacterium]|nr:sterol desaturase family protein [Stellaceae bacterium]
MFFLPTLLILAGTYSALLALVLLARAVERVRPVERDQSRAHLLLDWKLAAVNIGLNSLFAPAAKASGAFIVNWAGGGWIALRADGWWFLPSFALVLLANDLFAYLWHRAQHKLPALWAMHSLHHSAEALNIITGARHFWLETVITTAFLPVLAILFKIPHAIVVAVVASALLPDGASHLNLRLPLGRFALLVNNPQYHRIHHSLEPQHQNKNFCKVLPLFDVIFGTAWRPGRDEFPAPGLLPHDVPAGFLDGIRWPLRRWFLARPAKRADLGPERA